MKILQSKSDRKSFCANKTLGNWLCIKYESTDLLNAYTQRAIRQ